MEFATYVCIERVESLIFTEAKSNVKKIKIVGGYVYILPTVFVILESNASSG